MKKILLFFVLCLVVGVCGCAADDEAISYQTKYIINTHTAELHEGPSNYSSVIAKVGVGEAVSFVKDDVNGYSEVVYDGVTGYVLSTYLADEKPETKVADSTPPQKVEADENKYQYLISYMNESEIENYISSFVRPLYNRTNENIDTYSKTVSGNTTLWNDGKGCIKKEIPQGADGYNMSRQYYYDTQNGDVVFAFVFKGETEYRLYFKEDKLIRFIDEAGNISDNPTSDKALSMAARILTEAY